MLNRRLILPGLFVALSACGTLTGPADEALADAKAKWAEKGTASYDFQTSRLCFCVWESRSVQVSVRNGVVTTATYVDNGDPVPAALVADIKTVPDLFDMIDDARASHAAALSTSYDPVYGYPTRIQVDYSATTMDDEITVLTAGLVLVSPLVQRP